MSILADVFNYGGKLQKEPTYLERKYNEESSLARTQRRSKEGADAIRTTEADLQVAWKAKIGAAEGAELESLNAVDLNNPTISDYITVYGYEKGGEIATKNTTIANAMLGDSDQFKKEFDWSLSKPILDESGKFTGQIDLPVRYTNLKTGESYTADLTTSGEKTSKVFQEQGQAGLDADKRTLDVGDLDEGYLLTRDAIFRQAGYDTAVSRLQGANQGIDNGIYTEAGPREALFSQLDAQVPTEGAEAEAEAGTGAGAGAGTTTQMSGVITVDNIDSLGVTTDVAFSDRNIINKIIEVESSGRLDVPDSKHGATGLMQLKQGTLDNPGFGVKPAVRSGPNGEVSAEENVRVGTDYFDAMTEKYNGDLVLAAMAYNAGPGTIDKWIEGGRKYEDLREETQNYIAKVFGEDVREQVKNGTYGQGDSIPAASGQALPENLSDDLIDVMKSDAMAGIQIGKKADWAKSYYTKGPAPFGLTVEEFNSDRFSDKERRQLQKNENNLVTKNISKLFTDKIDYGIMKGSIPDAIRNFLKIPSDEKISVEDRNKLNEIREAYKHGGVLGRGTKLKNALIANPKLRQEFENDPAAFALKYKDNPTAVFGNDINRKEGQNLVKQMNKEFDFSQAKVNALKTAITNGNQEAIVAAANAITNGKAPSTEVQTQIVNILTKAENNIKLRGINKRINDRIVLGIIASDPQLLANNMNTIISFAQTGVLDIGAATAQTNAQVGMINARKPDVTISNKIIDFKLFDDNQQLVNATGLVELGMNARSQEDRRAYAIKAGQWVKEWAQANSKTGFWQELLSFGRAYGSDKNQFSAQPNLSFDGKEFFFLDNRNGRTGGSISADKAQKELGPEGYQLLLAAASRNKEPK